MPTVSARNAKNRFGDLLLAAQREPVVIEKNGKPVAVVTSFADHEAAEPVAGRRDLATVLRTLQAQEATLRTLGVTGAWVFGSLARGDARPGGDVDLLVDLDPKRRIDVMDYAWIVGEIESLFAGRVDVAERRALRHDVAREAREDAIRAF